MSLDVDISRHRHPAVTVGRQLETTALVGGHLTIALQATRVLASSAVIGEQLQMSAAFAGQTYDRTEVLEYVEGGIIMYAEGGIISFVA